MPQQLVEILAELGLTQYRDNFVEQGFDTWDTILDITESDLDALGVKLGHRRKLQRRIAKFRGVAPEVALISPTRANTEEAQRPPETAPKPDASSFGLDSRGAVPGVLAKRKYRRHPKADECAPERPPSAYVLFSNKMREELKGKNLSFTEIAKLVGEHWQGLSPAEREPFETQAQLAKDKYSHDLAVYKKTPEYKKYMVYLQEFKAKHSTQTQGVSYFFPANDKDAFKRIKLSDFGGSGHAHASTEASSASPQGHAGAAHHRHPDHRPSRHVAGHDSRSGSESPLHEHDVHDEPSSSRKRRVRVGSSASIDSQRFSASPTPGLAHSPPHSHPSIDHPAHAHHAHRAHHGHRARHSHPSSLSPREAPPSSQPAPPRRDDNASSSHVSLPSLSDMLDNSIQLSAAGGPAGGSNYGHGSAAAQGGASPGLPPPGMGGAASGYPRTPLDGSLPIHALLSGKPLSPASVHATPAAPHHQLHHSHHHAAPPRPSPPPAWPYSQAPGDHAPMYQKHGGGSPVLQHNSGASYQFQS